MMRIICVFLALHAHFSVAFRFRRGVAARVQRSGKKTGPTTDQYLELRNFQNVQYFGDFTVGGQLLPVIYDTGSFEIIVLSDLCSTCESAAPMYSQERSGTWSQGENIVAKHVFGSGPVVSQKNAETVHVGTVASLLMAESMPFWQVLEHDIDVWDKHSQFSGIVGLGHSPNTPNMEARNESDPVFGTDESLLTAVGVTAFSVCLERSEGTPPGWLVMGPTAENAQYDSKFKSVPVVGQIHWGVQMTHLQAGGHHSFDACSPSCAAIVDSGTSLIAAPQAAMSALAPVFNMIDPECRNLESLPDITFTLGTETFAIPPSIYVIKMTGYLPEEQGIIESLFGPPDLREVTQCIPAFMEINMETEDYGPMWILGMPFLRYYYTVFQRQPKSLHIAYATASCEASGDIASIYFGNASNHTVFANKTRASNHASLSVASQLRTVNASGLRLPRWAQSGMKTKNSRQTVKFHM